ncbi:MAG: type II secretion system F family protein [bacterium]
MTLISSVTLAAFVDLPVAPLVSALVAFGAAIVIGSRSFGVGRAESAAPASTPAAAPSPTVSATASRWIPASTRVSLDAAGIVGVDQQFLFVLVHACCIVVGGVIAAVGASYIDSGMVGTLIFAAGLVIGWWLPVSWLAMRRERRRAEIEADFPVMLDLLQIALEGGLGLAAAWTKVRETLRGSSDVLGEEMHRVEIEVEFGASWAEALDRAATRSEASAFRSLSSLFGQSERFGTELSRVVVVLSDSLRLESSQALEERAHVASVRLLVPLGTLLLPATIVVLVGPLFFMLFETLQGVNAD